MGRISSPRPVKLFVGALTSLPALVTQVEDRLSVEFGPMDLQSGPYPFSDTHYYDLEMGTPIERYFFGFSGLNSPEALAAIKIKTNSIEELFAAENQQVARPVNLDPGYLELAKVVLASTKNFYHRILLSDGIYAEVTLHYENGAWQPLPWTFPDFRSGRYNDFFTRLREKYRADLKTQCQVSRNV